jgi:hypothetical protein
LTSNKAFSVFFQANYKEFSTLDATMLLFVYNHHGYLLKLPIILSDDQENGPGLVMTGLITLAANALAYAGYKLMKIRKTKKITREQKTAFERYRSDIERANTYLVES